MSYTAIDCRKVRARKEYRCSWCGEAIRVGEVHQYRVYRYHEAFITSREHIECAEAMDSLTSKQWEDMDWIYKDGEYKRGTTEIK